MEPQNLSYLQMICSVPVACPCESFWNYTNAEVATKDRILLSHVEMAPVIEQASINVDTKRLKLTGDMHGHVVLENILHLHEFKNPAWCFASSRQPTFP